MQSSQEQRAAQTYGELRTRERRASTTRDIATARREQAGEAPSDAVKYIDDIPTSTNIQQAAVEDALAYNKEQIENINQLVRRGKMDTTEADRRVERLEKEIYRLEDRQKKLQGTNSESPTDNEKVGVSITERETELEKQQERGKKLPQAAQEKLRTAYEEERDRIASKEQEESQEKTTLSWKERARKTFRWVEGRVESMLTLGYWDISQAKKFEAAQNKVATNLAKELNKLLKQRPSALEGYLKYQSEELHVITKALKENNAGNYKDLSGQQKKELKAVLDAIREENKNTLQEVRTAQTNLFLEANEKQIDNVIESAVNQLKEKLGGYKNEFKEQVILDEDRLATFRNKLRREIEKLAAEQTEVDARRLFSIIEDSFDPGYWRRYIYGTLEGGIIGGLVFISSTSPTNKIEQTEQSTNN